jgi:hypothetical protein
MTVCIAAIAAKSKAIVMIADKASTFGTKKPMQADVGIKKDSPGRPDRMARFSRRRPELC